MRTTIDNVVADEPASMDPPEGVIHEGPETVTMTKELYERLMRESLTDHLTGFFNKRAYAQQLDHDLEVARRNRQQEKGKDKGIDNLSLIYIDINGLKYVNDNFGHDAGDELIVDAARIIKQYFKRKSDTHVRVGGDELVVICPALDYEMARERVREMVQAAHEQGVSMSVGVSNYAITVNDPLVNGQYTQPFELVKAELQAVAEQAMYDKKNTLYDKIPKEEFTEAFYRERFACKYVEIEKATPEQVA